MNAEIKGIWPWIGGFEQTNPDFKYPKPNLESLPLLDNMDNIDKLCRQMDVKWPEFSWLTHPGHEQSRCYQRFASHISRIGYTQEGRVYSIICPQQGVWLKNAGINLNVEVTVTGQRGWVNEDNREFAADLTVTGKIWFSIDDACDNPCSKFLFHVAGHSKNSKLPFSKANAIEVETCSEYDPTSDKLALRIGETKLFTSPAFARHDEAYKVGNVSVRIVGIKKTECIITDKFNEITFGLFNILSGNMLKENNVLSWNVWFTDPAIVDRAEWQEHAEKWRHSIDVDHRYPGSTEEQPTNPRYFDGTDFKVSETEAFFSVLRLVKLVLSPSASKLELDMKYIADLGEMAVRELSTKLMQHMKQVPQSVY